MNIYMRELKAHRKSLIIWSVSMALLIAGGMGKYSAGMGAGAGGFNEMIDIFPESLQKLFGVGVLDLTNVLDYFGVLFIYLALMVAVHAAMLGAGIISKEERDKTAEFLMVKPVSRTKIVTSKMLAAVTIVLIFNVVTSVSSYGMLSIYANGTPFANGLVKLTVSLLAVQILFVAIGSFCAAIISNPKLSSAVATGILLFMFMLSVMVDLTDKLAQLKYITIFKYFDAKYILKGGYEAAYPILSVMLLIACVYSTYHFYKKRDMKI